MSSEVWYWPWRPTNNFTNDILMLKNAQHYSKDREKQLHPLAVIGLQRIPLTLTRSMMTANETVLALQRHANHGDTVRKPFCIFASFNKSHPPRLVSPACYYRGLSHVPKKFKAPRTIRTEARKDSTIADTVSKIFRKDPNRIKEFIRVYSVMVHGSRS